MKKIVCEICGSQKLKKENGMFVCQECGTEYSLDEARNLLVDVDSSEPISEKPVATRNGQAELRGQLVLWASLLKQIEDLDFYFDLSGLDTYKFWSGDSVKENVPAAVGRRTFSLISKQAIEYDAAGSDTKGMVLLLDEKFCLDLLATYERASRRSDLAKHGYKEKYEGYKRLLSDHDLILCRYYCLDEISKLALNHFIFDELKEMNNIIANCDTYDQLENCFEGDYCLLAFGIDFENGKRIVRPDFNDIDFERYRNRIANLAYEHGRFAHINRIEQKWYGPKYTPLVLSFDINQLVEKCYGEYERIDRGIGAFYEKEVTPIVEEGYSVMSKCISLSKELEKEFNLPVKYRRLEHVLSMIELLDEGKASDWKELVNLYDTGNYRKEVLSDLSEINAKMDNLIASVNTTNEQLFSMGSAMKEIGFSLSSIAVQAHKISASASRFEKYSKITMISSL